MKAAQYLGTTPWEMELVPWRYVLQAEAAQSAEHYASEHKTDGP